MLPEMVGGGVGTPRLRLALDRLRRDGATSVYVRTEADNARALGFYRARGFGDERELVEEVEGQPVRLTELRRPLEADTGADPARRYPSAPWVDGRQVAPVPHA